MTVILSPFHLDERLEGPWPLEADVTIDPALPEGTSWERMAVLATGIADAVAGTMRAGRLPVVISGDCVAALAVGRVEARDVWGLAWLYWVVGV